MCAVTRAMAAALPDTGATKDLAKVLSFAVPNDLCISCADLVQEQKKDPSLKDLYELVVPSCQVGNIRPGYVLKDDMLLRVWAPHGDGFSGDPIVKVVLPEKF